MRSLLRKKEKLLEDDKNQLIISSCYFLSSNVRGLVGLSNEYLHRWCQVSTSFSFGEKLFIDDGRNMEEWVTHSEEDSVVVRGSHDDEYDKRERGLDSDLVLVPQVV